MKSHLFDVPILLLIFSALFNLQSPFCQSISVFCLCMLKHLTGYCPEAAGGRRAYKNVVSDIQKNTGIFCIFSFQSSRLEIVSVTCRWALYYISFQCGDMYFWCKGDENRLKLKEDVFITTTKGVILMKHHISNI